jgi:hypothetical protein
MSEPVFHDLQQSKPAARPAVARARLRKLEGAAVAALLTCQAATGLPVCALGAIPALCAYLVGRQNLSELGSNMSPEEAGDALLRRGLPQMELVSVLSSLTAAGFLSHAEGRVTVPLFDVELDEHLAKFANRSAGRDKCTAQATKQTEVPAHARPAAPTLIDEEPAQQPLLDAPAPTTSGQKRADVKLKKQQLRAGQDNRFGPTDGVAPDESDPTVARIVCECGGYAEITQSYIDHLKLAYRGLDVLDAVRRAALWCDGNRAKRKKMTGIRRFLTSWLNNQSRDADVRAAVVRANSQRNGFGQGGAYGAPVSAESGAAHPVGAYGAELDFDDLTVEPGQKATPEVAPGHSEAAPVAARVSPVARARARVQVAAVGQTSPLRQPASPQLRLSEQLR